MIPGAPREARWVRSEPRRTLPLPLLERMVHCACPHGRLVEFQPLTDGLRNSNFKLRIDVVPGPVVLRVYVHDPTICQKEIDLLAFVGKAVPVPEVIYAAPEPDEQLLPFALLHYVERIAFRELKPTICFRSGR